jgi:hypothetical protein
MAEKQKRVRIAMESFIKTWEDSKSVPEVAEKLGLKVTSVMARASKYRGEPFNLPLKGMQRANGTKKFNIETAKNFLATLRGTTTEVIEAESQALATKHAVKAAK